MNFRERLKFEMEYLGITTKELSVKSGVNKRTLDHYLMTKPQEPSVSNAFKIAQALNVSLDYLMGVSENSQNEQSHEIKKMTKLMKSLSGRDRKLLLALAENMQDISKS